MNQNLDLLRQNTCRPAVAPTGKGNQLPFSFGKRGAGETLLISDRRSSAASRKRSLAPMVCIRPIEMKRRVGASSLCEVFDLKVTPFKLTFENHHDSIAPGNRAKVASLVHSIFRRPSSVRKINKATKERIEKGTESCHSGIVTVLPISSKARYNRLALRWRPAILRERVAPGSQSYVSGSH